MQYPVWSGGSGGFRGEKEFKNPDTSISLPLHSESWTCTSDFNSISPKKRVGRLQKEQNVEHDSTSELTSFSLPSPIPILPFHSTLPHNLIFLSRWLRICWCRWKSFSLFTSMLLSTQLLLLLLQLPACCSATAGT